VWARGQSWVINGLTVAYRFTHDPAHLAGAQNAAECFIRRMNACCGPSSQYKGAPKWDFNVVDSAPMNKVDTSAAMIAAEGLAELSGYVSPADGARYLQFARTLLTSISTNYLAPPASPALLSNGTVTYPLAGVSITYGDYYAIRAAAKIDAASAALKAAADALPALH
jgi:unsaturated chondroitin disaccharide hydrolase